MRSYELTIVLPGGASAVKKKSLGEKIERMVKSGSGKIKSSNEWGKIDLAFKIKKETQGVFIFMELEMEAPGAKNLKNKLRLENDIIRYLLIKKD